MKKSSKLALSTFLWMVGGSPLLMWLSIAFAKLLGESFGLAHTGLNYYDNLSIVPAIFLLALYAIIAKELLILTLREFKRATDSQKEED